MTGCGCLRIEAHHRLQSCCQGQVLAPSGASCVFSAIAECCTVIGNWPSGLEKQSHKRKRVRLSCIYFGH